MMISMSGMGFIPQMSIEDRSMTKAPSKTSPLLLMLFWLYVGIPLLWGVLATLKKAMALFGG